jgi:hypothetical protein
MPVMKCTSRKGTVYTYEITSDKVKEYRRNSTIPHKRGQARRHAIKKGIEFTLTTAFLKELWAKQDGKCALSGVALGKLGDGYLSPSIDRIDNEKGYVEDNVWWLAWRVNEAKKDMLLDDFTLMCKAVSEGATTISKESTPKQVEAQGILKRMMI